ATRVAARRGSGLTPRGGRPGESGPSAGGDVHTARAPSTVPEVPRVGTESGARRSRAQGAQDGPAVRVRGPPAVAGRFAPAGESKARDDAGVPLSPGMTLLSRTGADELWGDPFRFTSEYPGLDAEASRWLLDQGIVNLGTDAVSTDTPADPDYPNHAAHAEQ